MLSFFNRFIAAAPQGIDAETELTAYITTALNDMTVKAANLAAESAHDPMARPKWIILSKLTNELKRVPVTINSNLNLDEKLAARQVIIKKMMDIVNTNLQNDQVRILLRKRNNKQLYVNIGVSYGIFVAGITTSVVFPNTFIGVLMSYLSAYQLVSSSTNNSFNSFVPATIALIFDFAKKLEMLDKKLTWHLDKTKTPQKTYYDLLDVAPTAKSDEILKSFRKLALIHHPDRPGGNAEMFKQVNLAKETLMDESKRIIYDASLSDNSVFHSVSSNRTR